MKAVKPEIRDFYSPTRSRRKFNSTLFIQLSISDALTPCGQGHHLKHRQLHIEPLFVDVFADGTEFIEEGRNQGSNNVSISFINIYFLNII